MSLLTVRCIEKGVEVDHSISLMSMSVENLKTLWERSKKYPTLFGIESTSDFGHFCSIFIHYDSSDTVQGNGLVWIIDDFVGIFYMTDIYAPDDATVHFSFLDGRIKGRVPLAKAMLEYVFLKYKFRRLSASVPLYAIEKDYKRIVEREKVSGNVYNPLEHGLFKFVQDIGFKVEGRKRKVAEYKGDYFDAIQFGILQEEVNYNG